MAGVKSYSRWFLTTGSITPEKRVLKGRRENYAETPVKIMLLLKTPKITNNQRVRTRPAMSSLQDLHIVMTLPVVENHRLYDRFPSGNLKSAQNYDQRLKPPGKTKPGGFFRPIL
jgi:hypothetical protein